MKVILLEEIKNIGKKGDIVQVKDGYARNYLIPRSFAAPATKGNMRMLEDLKKQQSIKDARDKEEAIAISEKLAAEQFVIESKAGEKGKLYGSITSADIAMTVEKQTRIELDKRKIVIETPIKEVGKHTVRVKLYPEVEAELNLQIKALEEE